MELLMQLLVLQSLTGLHFLIGGASLLVGAGLVGLRRWVKRRRAERTPENSASPKAD